MVAPQFAKMRFRPNPRKTKSSQQKLSKQYNYPPGIPLSENSPSFPGHDPWESRDFLGFFLIQSILEKQESIFSGDFCYYDFRNKKYNLPFDIYFSGIF